MAHCLAHSIAFQPKNNIPMMQKGRWTSIQVSEGGRVKRIILMASDMARVQIDNQHGYEVNLFIFILGLHLFVDFPSWIFVCWFWCQVLRFPGNRLFFIVHCTLTFSPILLCSFHRLNFGINTLVYGANHSHGRIQAFTSIGQNVLWIFSMNSKEFLECYYERKGAIVLSVDAIALCGRTSLSLSFSHCWNPISPSSLDTLLPYTPPSLVVLRFVSHRFQSR